MDAISKEIPVIYINSSKIITPELSEGAIINDEYKGFKEDYLVLHCLLKKHYLQIHNFLEIGTNMGTGTNIICNALSRFAKVYSMDLPLDQVHASLQHPVNEGKGSNVGMKCKFPFTQILHDSRTFDYENFEPRIDAAFIDAEHVYDNVKVETAGVLKHIPKLIIWHDTDIPEVLRGVIDGITESRRKGLYTLFRVTDTRISFLLKFNLNNL